MSIFILIGFILALPIYYAQYQTRKIIDKKSTAKVILLLSVLSDITFIIAFIFGTTIKVVLDENPSYQYGVLISIIVLLLLLITVIFNSFIWGQFAIRYDRFIKTMGIYNAPKINVNIFIHRIWLHFFLGISALITIPYCLWKLIQIFLFFNMSKTYNYEIYQSYKEIYLLKK